MSDPAAKHADGSRRKTADYIISTGRPVTECCRELGLDLKTVDKIDREEQRHIRGLEMENALLKTSRALLWQRAGEYRLMPEEKTEFPVSLMARVLEASRSGFCPRDDRAAERDGTMRVRLESDRRLGSRFLRAMLPPDFCHLARYRVLRLMCELGMRGCTPNARRRTTIPVGNVKFFAHFES